MSNACDLRRVLGGVPERRVDAALGRAGMAAGRVELRDHADVRACVVGLDGRAHAGAAGADDQDVVRCFHVTLAEALRGEKPSAFSPLAPGRLASRSRMRVVARLPDHGRLRAGRACEPDVRRRRRSASRSCRRTSRRARAPCGRTRPGRAQVERGSSSFGSTPGTATRHLEAEDLVGAELGVVELAGERGVQHRARRLDRHPLALAERAAGPAGVDEPDARAVLVELLAEHPRVDRRRLRQERLAEAGREGRLRLGDADLGAGELRGEAGEEVVERLLAARASRSAAGSRTRRR